MINIGSRGIIDTNSPVLQVESNQIGTCLHLPSEALSIEAALIGHTLVEFVTCRGTAVDVGFFALSLAGVYDERAISIGLICHGNLSCIDTTTLMLESIVIVFGIPVGASHTAHHSHHFGHCSLYSLCVELNQIPVDTAGKPCSRACPPGKGFATTIQISGQESIGGLIFIQNGIGTVCTAGTYGERSSLKHRTRMMSVGIGRTSQVSLCTEIAESISAFNACHIENILGEISGELCGAQLGTFLLIHTIAVTLISIEIGSWLGSISLVGAYVVITFLYLYARIGELHLSHLLNYGFIYGFKHPGSSLTLLTVTIPQVYRFPTRTRTHSCTITRLYIQIGIELEGAITTCGCREGDGMRHL